MQQSGSSRQYVINHEDRTYSNSQAWQSTAYQGAHDLQKSKAISLGYARFLAYEVAWTEQVQKYQQHHSLLDNAKCL